MRQHFTPSIFIFYQALGHPPSELKLTQAFSRYGYWIRPPASAKVGAHWQDSPTTFFILAKKKPHANARGFKLTVLVYVLAIFCRRSKVKVTKRTL